MRVSIRNFIRCQRADLAWSRVCLLAGINEAGKTSVARGIAAALTGSPIPVPGLAKANAGMLVHAGTGGGTVTVEGDEGQVTVTYPAAKIESEGTPPSASLIAAGLSSFLDMDKATRSTTLIATLKATPTEMDIRAAGAAIHLDSRECDVLVQRVTELTWDGAHNDAKERGARLKGQWEATTKDRYGSAKAERWIPEGWSPELDSESEDALKGQVAQAREAVEACIAVTAVDDAERARLAASAETIPALTDEVAERRKNGLTITARLDALNAELAALPRPPAEETTVACPHCQRPVVVRGGNLFAPATATAAEIAARKDAIDAKQLEIAAFTASYRAAERLMREASGKLALAKADAEALAALPPASTGAAEDVSQAREVLALAESRLKAFTAKRDADRTAAAIIKNADVVALLSPTGLRLSKLRDAVRALNVEMATLCVTAGWKLVEIDNDLNVHVGGTPYALCSGGAQFRARVVIQAALACHDGSLLVIVDAADILVGPGARSGLVRMMASLRMPALVCVSLPTKADVPSLDSPDGAYWIENGIAEAVL